MAARNVAVPILLGLAVFGAVVAGGLVIQHYRAQAPEAPVVTAAQPNPETPPPRAPAKEGPRAVPDWQKYIPTGRIIGPSNAALTIVEYADYQCPACKTLHDQLTEMRSKYPEDLAISYHYVPLPYHEMAYPAARAAECAAEQGRFEPYHDALYANPELIEEGNFRSIARKAQIPDLQKFSKCAARTDPVPRIESDQTTALGTLRITGTPSVLVNGMMYSYAPSMDDLRQMIEAARAH